MTLADALVGGSEALAAALEACGVGLAQLEASVRGGEDGARGERMMIERAQEGVLDAVLAAFAVPRVEAIDALLGLARELEVPRIVGWDAARGCVKLYANASDAPERARARLGAHLVGVNVFCDGSVEQKLYVQHVSGVTTDPRLSSLVEAAGELCAGTVESRDADGTPRAYFVALRPASPEALDRAFGHLPGFSFAALVARSPFAPASPRSIGIAAARPTEWTAYVKPRGVDEPAVWALEPIAVFASDAGEVALHVSRTGRAYTVVDGLALSYRVLRGAPSRADLDALIEWLAERARAAAGDPARVDVAAAPPPPWRRSS